MSNGFNTASTVVSHVWSQQLREHLPVCAELSLWWAKSRGDDWHHVASFRVNHERSTESAWLVELVADGGAELVKDGATEPPERPETIAQDLWECVTEAGVAVARELGKGGLRGRLVMLSQDGEELNDVRSTQKRLPTSAAAEVEAEDEEDADIKATRCPHCHDMKLEVKRLRKIVSTVDAGTLTRLETAAKVEEQYARLGERTAAWEEKQSERLAKAMDDMLSESRSDMFAQFLLESVGPKVPHLLDSLAVYLRSANGRDPKQCEPMPMHFAMWTLSTFGATDHSAQAALHMKASETPPDSPGWAENWTALLRSCEDLMAQAVDQDRPPMEADHAAMFRTWVRSCCKALDQDPRRYPFSTVDRKGKAE